MVGEKILIDGKRCLLYSVGEPEVLLVEPMDEQDLEFLDRELGILKAEAGRPFALAALIIEDWNSELAPWPAEPVFGKDPFTGGAPDTLRLIEDKLIPKVESLYPSLKDGRRIIGGYSLSALFALWCAYESGSFDGVAAASPSVWYPGWMEFVRKHGPKAHSIYLSLGAMLADEVHPTRIPFQGGSHTFSCRKDFRVFPDAGFHSGQRPVPGLIFLIPEAQINVVRLGAMVADEFHPTWIPDGRRGGCNTVKGFALIGAPESEQC